MEVPFNFGIVLSVTGYSGSGSGDGSGSGSGSGSSGSGSGGWEENARAWSDDEDY